MFMEKNFFEEKIMNGEYIRYNGHNERNVLKPYGQKVDYMKNMKTSELHVTAPKKLVIKVGDVVASATGAVIQQPKRRAFKDAIEFDGTERSAQAIVKAYGKSLRTMFPTLTKGVKFSCELYQRKNGKMALVVDSKYEAYKLTVEENFCLCIGAKQGMSILHRDRLQAHYARIPRFSIAGIAAMFGIFR